MADGGEDKGTGSRQSERGAIEGPEHSTAGGDAVLGATGKAAPHTIAQTTLFLCLTAARVTLDQIPPNALATLGTFAIPELLLWLTQRRRQCSVVFVLESILNQCQS